MYYFRPQQRQTPSPFFELGLLGFGFNYNLTSDFMQSLKQTSD